MVDKYKRTIDYARISLTSKCNLQCKYCYSKSSYSLDYNDVYIILDALKSLKFNKVRFTGGEPLLYENIEEVVTYACKHFSDVAITTNGVLLHKYLTIFKKIGLKRINISLDTLDENQFYMVTANKKLMQVLNNIKLAKKAGFDVKINVVLIKSLRENILKFIEFGDKYGIEIRFIELMKLGSNSEFVNNNYLASSEVIKDLKCSKVSSNKHDVCEYYELNGYKFAFISPISNHFCKKCNRIRFTSSYKLRLCLHAKNDYDIKSFLNNSEELANFVKQVIYDKQEAHLLNDNQVTDEDMVKIGG